MLWTSPSPDAEEAPLSGPRSSGPEREIELKFLCEPRDLDALLAAAPEGETELKALRATYFDTPDGRLKARRISLRVRESGGKHVQTLKRGDGFGREEYEQRVEALDLDMPALKKALTGPRRRALAPAFTVAVERRQRVVTYHGAAVEIAADLGTIQAGEARREISELELELKAGSPRALFDLARELSKTAPLYLSYEGKAAQGQALGDGALLAPRRLEKIALDADLSAAEAFQVIARASLSAIAANAALVRETSDEAALHQLRVAVRRLRSAIAACADLVGDAEAPAIRAALKWLAGTCGEARDLDVFVASLEGAPEAALLAEPLAQARAHAYAKACAALSSGRFRDLVIEAAAWIETGAWVAGPGKAPAQRRAEPARAFAARALAQRWKAWKRLAEDFESLDVAGRHRLRLKAKGLRYAAEAFASLFPARPAARLVTRVKALQDELGALNDAAVAKALLDGLRLDLAQREAASSLIAARAGNGKRGLKRARKAAERVAESEKFWR